MMRGYHLVPLADADPEDILFYVAMESGPAAADRLEAEFHEVMERIAFAPSAGHTRADLSGLPLRFVPHHKWMIAYRPETRPVQIIRILHGARDVASILGDPRGPE